MTYKGKRVTINIDGEIRKGVCACCGKAGFTALHHWKYAYALKDIRKNPELALKNTTELCYRCHELANALRKLNEADKIIIERLRGLAV